MLLQRFTPAGLPKPAVTPQSREGGKFLFPPEAQKIFERDACTYFEQGRPLERRHVAGATLDTTDHITPMLDYISRLSISKFVEKFGTDSIKLKQIKSEGKHKFTLFPQGEDSNSVYLQGVLQNGRFWSSDFVESGDVFASAVLDPKRTVNGKHPEVTRESNRIDNEIKERLYTFGLHPREFGANHVKSNEYLFGSGVFS
jgi:hypothetical protein